MSTAVPVSQSHHQANEQPPSELIKKRRLTYIIPLPAASSGRLLLGLPKKNSSSHPRLLQHALPPVLPINPIESSRPAPTKPIDADQPAHRQHPTHSLGINSLLIDLTTPIKHHDHPNGILYSAGKDGLIAAWELNLPTRSTASTNPSRHSPRSFQLDQAKLANHPPPPTTFRQCIQPHTDWINDIILCNQNQTLISASSDRTVKAWSPHSPQNALCPTTIGTHLDYVKCLAHSPFSAWVASAGLDRRILLWDTTESRPNPLVRFSEHTIATSIYSLAATPTGQLLAAGSPAQAIGLYDPRLGSQVAKLVGHTDNVRSILLSDDGSRLLSASSDATVKMWDIRIQRCQHTFSHHSTSVWALHSQHPRLERFHSGDRAGWLCKVDLEGSDDFREGECVVLGQAGRHDQQNPDLFNQAITKIVGLDNAFVWTATGSSTIERWRDIPTRAQRRQLLAGSANHQSSLDPSHSPPTPHFSDSHPKSQSKLSPAPSTDHLPPPPLRSPQSVSFNLDLSPSTLITTTHLPSAPSPLTPDLPRSSPASIIQQSPNRPSDTRLPSHVQPNELDGVPLEALVPLFSQFDHLLHNPEYNQDPESTTIHSPDLAISDSGIHRGLNYYTHSTTSSSSLRSPTYPGLEPIRILSPLTLEPKIDNLHTPTVINPHPRPPITATSAWRLYTTRDSAAEAIPLRDSADDLILGCSGLIKSELLNDCRHAITIDTSRRIALWDIIGCNCKGIFDPDELERELDHASSVGSSGSSANFAPSELLKLVKSRIEGQAAIGNWCTVETQTGLLTVHLEENRCFDGEVYADEAGLSEEVLGQMKEDHRLSLGKWVLRNLFEGFVNHQAQLRLRNTSTVTDSTSPTSAIQSRGEVESDEQKSSENRSIVSHSHHFPGRSFAPRTPGMTIALATPALTPAILPDLKTMVGSNGTPKNNPQAGDLVSHPSDYFSLPRLLEADEEQLGKGALTPGGLDSNTDASSSYSSSLYPPPSPRRASPAPASNDGLSRDDMAPLTDSPAASWTSNTTSSSAVQPNSANIFSRFRSLGRGQKRRNSQDPTAPPVISNPIPYREDGDRAEQDGQRQLLIEKIKAQQAQMVQAILSQPFEPCGTLDAPKLTLPPETTILISEQEPESGTWEVSYRGLVATTDLDSEILMDVLPGWLLNFLLGNRVSTREGSSAVKVTFVLQPEGGSEAAGLPELPNGNARLTASRVLRMKKVAAYVSQKLESSPPKIDARHPPASSSPSSSSSKPKSEVANQHKNHKSNSKSVGSAVSAGSSTTTTSNTHPPPHHHHPHHHHRHHKDEAHHSHSKNDERTPASSPSRHPQYPSPIDENQIVLSCNGQILPRPITLGVVKKWIWAKPSDVIIHYRRNELGSPT